MSAVWKKRRKTFWSMAPIKCHISNRHIVKVMLKPQNMYQRGDAFAEVSFCILNECLVLAVGVFSIMAPLGLLLLLHLVGVAHSLFCCQNLIRFSLNDLFKFLILF